MPSHIFVQLGLWRDVVSSNERAWAASRAEVAARKLSAADLSFHSLEWLQYGYLQSGRYSASREVIDVARHERASADVSQALHVDGRYTVSRLQFQHAANTEEWAGEICRMGPKAPQQGGSQREQSFAAVAWYQASVATAMCGRVAEALESLRSISPDKPPTQSAAFVQRLGVLHVQLVSYLRGGDGEVDVETLLAAAANTPSAAPSGPPPGLGTEELVGAALLKRGQAAEAVAAYEKSLQLTPNRSVALLGLARAHAAAGNEKAATDAYRQLRDNWQNADADLPLTQEVKDGAAGRHGSQ
jgi:tetratricopeptide (TPR) repeat protein